MMPRPDVRTAETKPFTQTAAHEALLAMTGPWEGQTKTWLDPDPKVEPEASTTTAVAESLLGGRFVRLTYQGVVMGVPHAGEMTVGHEEGRFHMAWIDSFHTGAALMQLFGEKGASVVSCLGSYAAGEARWGWRIRVSRPASHELLVEEWNIAPGGQEERAIEMRLRGL